MPIRFDCPSCKANYEVVDDLAGKIIMCRVCKKRGKVGSLPTQAASATAVQAAALAGAASMSRRSFLPMAGLVVASVGAIVSGALLARQPWNRPTGRDRGGPGRGPWGPPPDDAKKDGKSPSA